MANAGGVPLIMSYWNLIYHYGVERFACDFENAGGAGLITPDLIPDEAGEWIEASDRHGLDRIFLVSPDSASERLELVARNARGFVYAASRMGVTGERDTISASPETLVERARNAGARNVCVGIGVSTPEQGAKVGAYADGVIVASNKFCEYWSYERVIDTVVLPRDFGLPVCSIEKEYINSASGQLRTRFQAFVESVEIKKIQEGK